MCRSRILRVGVSISVPSLGASVLIYPTSSLWIFPIRKTTSAASAYFSPLFGHLQWRKSEREKGDDSRLFSSKKKRMATPIAHTHPRIHPWRHCRVMANRTDSHQARVKPSTGLTKHTRKHIYRKRCEEKERDTAVKLKGEGRGTHEKRK